MADRSIGSELNEVRKKLNDIERKQEFLEKVIQLERERQQKRGDTFIKYSRCRKVNNVLYSMS